MSDPTQTTPSSSPIGNVAPAEDHEVIFYEGTPRLRGELGMIFLCLIIAIVVAFICWPLGMVWKTYPGWLIIVTWLIALGILALPFLLVRRERYRISNYRIDYEQGLLSKRIDTIELWHVEDVQMRQSILNRIMQVGTINIASTDRTTPLLELHSLPEPRKLYDTIKQRVIAVKRQRGVLKMDAPAIEQPPADFGHHHG